VAAAIREMGDLGVTTVIIQPTEDEPDLDGFIRFLGAEVKPLLV
jgi:5,10-methylenetetrahydromethanopterin reductase